MRRTVSGLDMDALFGAGLLVSTVRLCRSYPPLTARGASEGVGRCSPKSEFAVAIRCQCGTERFSVITKTFCVSHILRWRSARHELLTDSDCELCRGYRA